MVTNPVNGRDYTAPGIHLRRLPGQQSIYDAASTEKARTTYEYDNYTVSATDPNHAALTDRLPNISGLDCTFTTGYQTRGNMTRVSRYLLPNTPLSTYQQYDIAGNVVKIIDPKCSTTTGCQGTRLYYDDNFGAPNGEARTNTPPAELLSPPSSPPPCMPGSQTSFAFPSLVTNVLGQTTYTQLDYYTGKPVDVEDQNQVVTSRWYADGLDRPTKIVLGSNTGYPDPSQTTFSYDGLNHIIETKRDLTTYTDGLLVSDLVYDGLGRTIETRQYEDTNTYTKTVQGYDALGRVSFVDNPLRCTMTPTPSCAAGDSTYGWTQNTYDALSRVIAVDTFDNVGTPTGTVQTQYSGAMVLVTDQAGKQRLSQSNALGQLTTVWEITPNDPVTYPGIESVSFAGQTLTGYRTGYLYDILNNLTTVTQGAQTRTYQYDSLSRLTSASQPEQVNSTGAFGTQLPTAYDYDANGNLLHRTDPRTITTTHSYDALNRLTQKTYSDTTPSVTYTYDTNVDGYNTYPAGRLVHVRLGDASWDAGYGYDGMGRVTMMRQNLAPGLTNMDILHSFNKAGLEVALEYPTGCWENTEYTNAGRISRIYAGAGGCIPGDRINSIQYTPHGALASQLFKGGFTNGFFYKIAYNSRLQPTEIRLDSNTTPSYNGLDMMYTYTTPPPPPPAQPPPPDNNGNVLSITTKADGLVPFTHTFTYDALNRLTSMTETRTGSAPWGQTFTLDRWGNRNCTGGDAAAPCSNVNFNTSTNRIQFPGYNYDYAGNLTNQAGLNPLMFTYDAENRITQVTDSTPTVQGQYAYDANGRRIKAVAGGATKWFLYDAGGRVLLEYTGAMSPVASKVYIYEGSEVGVTYPDHRSTFPGSWGYWVRDHLGTPRAILQANAETSPPGIRRRDFLPYGEQIRSGWRSTVDSYTVADVETHKFTGKERDDESGLDYFGARYYASALGRFMTVDPYNPVVDTQDKNDFDRSLGQPQNWNRYVFVWNNPLKYVDPNGEDVYVVTYTVGNSEGDDEFRRVAETRAKEIQKSKNFNSKQDTVLLRGVKTKEDFANVLKEANSLEKTFGKVSQISLFSHSGPGEGPVFHDATGVGVQFTQQELSQLNVNWSGTASAYFFGCNTAVNFCQNFANAQSVPSYGYEQYAYFSSKPDKREGPNATGPLYLISADGFAISTWGALRNMLGVGRVYPMVRRDPAPKDQPKR